MKPKGVPEVEGELLLVYYSFVLSRQDSVEFLHRLWNSLVTDSCENLKTE